MEAAEKKTRNTRQRAVILDILRASRFHPTAEEVYQEARRRMPRISLGTVYRNLNVLCARGIVREIRPHDAGGCRFDAGPEPHAHFHCRSCRSIIDIPLPSSLEALSFEGDERISRVEALELHAAGICQRCDKGGA